MIMFLIYFGSILRSIDLCKVLDLAFLKPLLVQWTRSFEQDSPKIIPSPWGLHCPWLNGSYFMVTISKNHLLKVGSIKLETMAL